MSQRSNKAIAFLLASVLLMAMLTACGSSSTAAPATSGPVSESTFEPVSEPTATVPPPAATEVPPTETAPALDPIGTSPENPAPLTEKVTTPDWEIQVLEVVRGGEAMTMLEQASAFNKPHEDPAMEYVLVKVRVKYVGTKDTAYVYGKIFRSMDGAGEIYKSVSSIDVEVPQPELEADLQPGEETEGWVAIQVGKDAPGALLVLWPYDSYENNTAIFTDSADKWYVALE